MRCTAGWFASAPYAGGAVERVIPTLGRGRRIDAGDGLDARDGLEVRERTAHVRRRVIAHGQLRRAGRGREADSESVQAGHDYGVGCFLLLFR